MTADKITLVKKDGLCSKAWKKSGGTWRQKERSWGSGVRSTRGKGGNSTTEEKGGS